MKKLVGFIIVLLVISCASKKEEVKADLPVQIHKLSKEFSFKIKEVISDSRCPEGVNCVWAGEVELVLSIYKESIFYKDESLIINFENFTKNKLLLEKYTSSQIIKSIEVLPEKKQGVEINLENYSLKIN